MLRIMKFIALDVIAKSTALTESVTEWVPEPSKLFKRKMDEHLLYFFFVSTFLTNTKH